MARRSDRFLRLVGEYDRALFVTHDNPDPDAVASAWALAVIVSEKARKPARIVAGGAIVRAENRRMLELLGPPIEFVEHVDPGENTAIIMVDCVPTAANHLLEGKDTQATMVIDHHELAGPRFRVRFRDIRPKLAATSTIVGQYLREQRVEPNADLATAMLYGIRSDALGAPDLSWTDQRIVSWISSFASHKKLAEIETAPLPREYYADLLLAMESTFVYGETALCFLPQATSTEIVGEVADLLIRCQCTERVLCAAVIGESVYLSVRASPAGGDASALVRATVDGLGHSGGHTHRAGGKLAIPNRSGKISEDLQSDLRARWLRACNTDPQRGSRLVARRQIIENL